MSSSSSSAAPSFWEESFLKEMSLKTDPDAESLVNDIVNDNDFNTLRSVFTQLNNNQDHINSSGLPPSVINYFNAEMQLPAWADHSKINLAQEVFSKYGPQISLLLNFKALPLCYSCKNGAKVLAATGRLNESGHDVSRVRRRLFETSQMVINTMSPGGLDPDGKGIITVKKVRLYHATIRYFLTHPKYNPQGWDVARYGQPINQEEMAGTLMAFSALIIGGLDQIGIELSEEEKDAYMHCWNIIGHFIGLDPKLYPANFQQGWDLGIAIIKRNQEESEDGKLLTKSLIDFSKEIFQGRFLDDVPEYLISYFLEDVSKIINVDIVKNLGVNETSNFVDRLLGKAFLKILELADDIEEHNALVQKIVSKYNTKMLEGIVASYLKTNNVEFYIPASLKESWKLN